MAPRQAGRRSLLFEDSAKMIVGNMGMVWIFFFPTAGRTQETKTPKAGGKEGTDAHPSSMYLCMYVWMCRVSNVPVVHLPLSPQRQKKKEQTKTKKQRKYYEDTVTNSKLHTRKTRTGFSVYMYFGMGSPTSSVGRQSRVRDKLLILGLESAVPKNGTAVIKRLNKPRYSLLSLHETGFLFW